MKARLLGLPDGSGHRLVLRRASLGLSFFMVVGGAHFLAEDDELHTRQRYVFSAGQIWPTGPTDGLGFLGSADAVRDLLLAAGGLLLAGILHTGASPWRHPA